MLKKIVENTNIKIFKEIANYLQDSNYTIKFLEMDYSFIRDNTVLYLIHIELNGDTLISIYYDKYELAGYMFGEKYYELYNIKTGDTIRYLEHETKELFEEVKRIIKY